MFGRKRFTPGHDAMLESRASLEDASAAFAVADEVIAGLGSELTQNNWAQRGYLAMQQRRQS